MSTINLVHDFFASSQGIQGFFSGNPDHFGERTLVPFFLCFPVVLFVVFMFSVLITAPFIESKAPSLSVIVFFCSFIGLSSLSWIGYSHLMAPSDDAYTHALITTGNTYDDFTIKSPFENKWIGGIGMLPLNKIAEDEVADKDSDDFHMEPGVIIGMDKKHLLYRIYLKDKDGGIWRMTTALFLVEEEIAHPEPPRKKIHDFSDEEKRGQADFEKIKH